jgi:hypothetical protein
LGPLAAPPLTAVLLALLVALARDFQASTMPQHQACGARLAAAGLWPDGFPRATRKDWREGPRTVGSGGPEWVSGAMTVRECR